MTEYLTTDTDLKKVADAIREMIGETAPLSFPDGFVSAIEGGGGWLIKFGTGTTIPMIVQVSNLTLIS